MKCSLFLTFLLVHLCTLLFGDSQAEQAQKRCNRAYKCSSEVKPVWTTDDDVNCEVLRNNCYLLNENCQRVNRGAPELRDIGEERCKKLCKSSPVCPEAVSPICAYYNEEKKTFPTECDMKKYACETGKTFDFFADGSC